MEEVLKNIFKKTENSHGNEIKKIYEEQNKRTDKTNLRTTKKGYLRRTAWYNGEREPDHGCTQAITIEKRRPLCKRKGNIFKETLKNSEREKNERVGCIHFSKLLR